METSEELIAKLESKTNELLTQDLPVYVENLSLEEAQQKGVYAPAGKSARTVAIGDFPTVGCG